MVFGRKRVGSEVRGLREERPHRKKTEFPGGNDFSGQQKSQPPAPVSGVPASTNRKEGGVRGAGLARESPWEVPQPCRDRTVVQPRRNWRQLPAGPKGRAVESWGTRTDKLGVVRAPPARHGKGCGQILPTRSSEGFRVSAPSFHLAGQTSPGCEATYRAALTLRSSSPASRPMPLSWISQTLM